MKNKLLILLICLSAQLQAQIPFEILVGEDRTTLDLMFFKYFKNKEDQASPWLFFHRNRASVDYRLTSTNHLPQFGFTEAISYNSEKGKGFAPVMVGQILTNAVYAKAGVQFAHIAKNTTAFSWLVIALTEDPMIDYFLLVRYTPELTKRLKAFLQLESINSFHTNQQRAFNFTQRFRMGIQWSSNQLGLGADLHQIIGQSNAYTHQFGVFVRHEF